MRCPKTLAGNSGGHGTAGGGLQAKGVLRLKREVGTKKVRVGGDMVEKCISVDSFKHS